METVVNLKSVAKFDHCFGCGVCTAVCPQHAISMELNTQGFFSPVVNKDCTQCSLCLNICAFNAKAELSFDLPLRVFAGWSKREDIRDNSTSGGVIFELCSEYIDRGYKVCAVRYNYENSRAEHFVFDSIDDLYLATGSKYIQSYSANALSSIDWAQGKYVIVGTPCMISSVRKLARMHKAEDRMLLIDFFCHGVPSYLMWQKYLQHVQGLVGEIRHISWRNKDNGWQESTAMKARGDKGRYLSFLSNGDLFFEFFLRDRCLNDCCYDHCVFKQTHSHADIRVGDLWSRRIDYLNNRLGINSILIRSPKGLEALTMCRNIYIEEEKLSKVLGTQILANPPRSESYKFVSRELQGELPLMRIHKRATRIERLHNLFSWSFYKNRFLYSKLRLKLGI